MARKGQKRKGGRGAGEPAGKKSRKEGENVFKEGERGFLIEASCCQDALRGNKDFRLWLEVEAEAADTTNNTSNAPSGMAASLEAELQELKSGGPDSRRFLAVGMVCKQVSFLRANCEEDRPSSLMLPFFGPKARKAFVSRFADRVFPVDGSCRPKMENLTELAKQVLGPVVGSRWRLCFEQFRGGWNTISRDDALRVCKDVLGESLQSVTDPEVTVFCTLNPRFVGLGVSALDAEDLQVPYDTADPDPDSEDEKEVTQAAAPATTATAKPATATATTTTTELAETTPAKEAV